VINRKYITTDFQRTVESTFEKFLLTNGEYFTQPFIYYQKLLI